ncbi:MAG: hypothetical protein ACFFB5_18715 [Promethearchaeota archaeon]
MLIRIYKSFQEVLTESIIFFSIYLAGISLLFIIFKETIFIWILIIFIPLNLTTTDRSTILKLFGIVLILVASLVGLNRSLIKTIGDIVLIAFFFIIIGTITDFIDFLMQRKRENHQIGIH